MIIYPWQSTRQKGILLYKVHIFIFLCEQIVMELPVEHGLLLDNLLDLAHAPFTHTSTFAKGWSVPRYISLAWRSLKKSQFFIKCPPKKLFFFFLISYLLPVNVETISPCIILQISRHENNKPSTQFKKVSSFQLMPNLLLWPISGTPTCLELLLSDLDLRIHFKSTYIGLTLWM